MAGSLEEHREQWEGGGGGGGGEGEGWEGACVGAEEGVGGGEGGMSE